MIARDLFSLAKHSSIYTLGVILSKLVGFVMIPVYTRLLTPSDYGILELLTMTVDVIAMLVGLGLTSAVMRYYYAYPEGEERRSVVSTAFLMSGSLIVAATLLCAPWTGTLAEVVLGNRSYGGLFQIALVSFAISAGLEIPFVLLRAKQQSSRVVGLNLVRLVLQLSLNIVFLVVLRMGVQGVLIANLIASCCLATYLVATTVCEVGIRFSPEQARALIRYGAPLVMVNVGSFIISFSDRYFLRMFASLSDVGIYSLAYRFAILISVFVAAPFGQIWAAKALELSTRPDAERFYADAFRYFNVVAVSVALALALFAPDAIRVMSNPAFAPAGGIVPVLALAYVFFAYRQFSYAGIWISKRSEFAALSSWIAVGLVLVLNWWMIPRWGAMGAAAATLGAYALEFLVTTYFSQRLVPVAYPWARIASTLLLGVVFGAVLVPATSNMPLPQSVSVKTVCLLVFLTMVIPFTALTAVERRRLFELTRHPAAWPHALRAHP